MRTILKIFGTSPFVPLQMHMEKVAMCVEKVPEILDAYRRHDSESVQRLSDNISELEHEADLIKHDIRNHLPRGLFMPVDRANLLRILNVQDSIANRAENFGVILTFKQAKTFEELDRAFDAFLEKCLETFWLARDVIAQLDELLESGFGGAEANIVRELVDKVSRKEYESDVAQRQLARVMFAGEDAISYADFYLWNRLTRQVAEIADRSDNLASAIRTTLENK